MRTQLSSESPYGYTRYGFAWHHVRHGAAAHLDYGCGSGRFLETLASKGIGRSVGADVSADAVQQARRRLPETEIVHLKQTGDLSFEDDTFDSISILDVIEHIHEQVAVLQELRRVLRDDGVLIVTVPGRHVFSFMDIGNLKFRFPRLHRWFYCLRHSRAQYEARYVNNPDGLIGDVSAKKRWHEHFSRGTMTKLLNEGGFEVVQFDGAGLFYRPIRVFGRLVGWCKPLQSLIHRVERWDARRFASANLFCLAGKERQAEADQKLPHESPSSDNYRATHAVQT